MSGHKLTRREAAKWTFGVLVAGLVASSPGFSERLREMELHLPETAAGGDASAQLEVFLDARPVLARGHALVGQGSQVLLRGQEGELLLNASAAFVCASCDGSSSVREIGQALAGRYALPVESAQVDVAGFLARLQQVGILSTTPGSCRLKREDEFQHVEAVI